MYYVILFYAIMDILRRYYWLYKLTVNVLNNYAPKKDAAVEYILNAMSLYSLIYIIHDCFIGNIIYFCVLRVNFSIVFFRKHQQYFAKLFQVGHIINNYKQSNYDIPISVYYI